jgi:hypothetical protein
VAVVGRYYDMLSRQLESLPAHAPYIHDGKKFAPVRK